MEAAPVNSGSIARPLLPFTLPRPTGATIRRRLANIARPLLAYLLIGAAAMVLYYAADWLMSAAAYMVAPLLAIAGLAGGALLNRPRSVLPWFVMAVGLGCFVTGDLLMFAAAMTGMLNAQLVTGGFYLTGYVLLGGGLMLMVRLRRPTYRLARLVDAGVLAVAMAVILWTGHLSGLMGNTSLPAVDRWIYLTFTAADAVLVGLAVYLLIAGQGYRIRSQQLLAVSAGLLLLTDLGYASVLAGGTYERGWIESARMLSYLTLGLAAMVPSMRLVTERQSGSDSRSSRLLLLVGAALGALTLFELLEASAAGQDPLVLVALLALTGLLLVRIHTVAREEVRQERRLAAMLAEASDGFVVLGSDGSVRLSSPAAERILGIPAVISKGRSVFEFIYLLHPEDRRAGNTSLQEVLTNAGASATRLVRVRRADGGYRLLSVTATNRIDDPVVAGTVINFHDVTLQMRTAADLERLATAVDQASEAVVVAGPDALIQYVNPAFERITGYHRDEVIGQNPRLLKSGEQSPAFYTAMWETLAAGNPWIADFINRRKDGSTYRASSVITPLRSDDGRVTGYVAVSRDLTRQRMLEDAAQQMARERALIAETIRAIDPRETPEDIGQAICNQVAGLDDVATTGLFIFELDGRAAPYGFAVSSGDQAPKRRVPKSRTAYLRGQSERGPWIEAWKDRQAHPYNELFMRVGVRAIAYAPVRDRGKVIGFLHISSAHPDAEERLSTALPALVEFADVCGTLIGVKIGDRVEASAQRQRIQAVIDEGAFFPVYQPLFDIVSGRIVGYEALTRFKDGTSPEVRFDEAIAVGLGEQLELAALREAIEGARPLAGGLWLNINASPAVIMAGGHLQELVAGNDHELVLEVTEHTEITDYAAFRRAVQKCGPRVRLAVDDAGAGFASLRHIIELRPHFVKLDRQMIAGIDRDEARQALVAGLRHFAEHTGCWLIAEGVETRAELKTLRDLDIRYAQGYLLGRPTPADKIGADGPS